MVDVGFVFDRREVVERGVQALPVEEDLDVVEHGAADWARVAHERRSMSSSFNDAKKLSATALSQHCRGRDSDWMILCSASRSVNSMDVYCVPRSEWNTSPDAGRRWAIAIRNASHTSSARM